MGDECPSHFPHSRRRAAAPSLLHPHRPCGHRVYSGTRARPRADAFQCNRELELPPTWRWNHGYGLQPFRFRLFAERRKEGGAPTLSWEAYNRSMVKLYNRLHVHREDDKYCDVLPCLVAAPTSAAANATLCASMQECVTGSGGIYHYQGVSTGAYVR